MWVSKTAIDSLDDLIAGAELPLPSSLDGDSYEKLLAWKLTHEYSLSSMLRNDPLVNGAWRRPWKGVGMTGFWR